MTLAASSDGGSTALGVVLILLGVVAYWVPVIIAFWRKMPNKAPILLIDLFAGWTGAGWLVALVMACWPKPKPQYAQPPYGYQVPPQP